jgi:hypothetical protein
VVFASRVPAATPWCVNDFCGRAAKSDAGIVIEAQIPQLPVLLLGRVVFS